MFNEVHQVNWVLIDVVIIFLLFLLLISVKIFKSSHRWRLKFSNRSLEKYSLSKSFNKEIDHSLSIKNCSLTRNSSLFKNYQKIPTILFIRTKFKKHLTNIMTEGLSSYGFNIINLKFKINSRVKNFRSLIEDEIQTLVPLVIDRFILEEIITIPQYILVSYSRFLAPTNRIISDPLNKGLLFINPRMSQDMIRDIKDIFGDNPQHRQIFYIFSRKSFLILKNPDLKYFLNEFDENFTSKVELITLEKSTRNFKYYETILLGSIIDIIENKLLKS